MKEHEEGRGAEQEREEKSMSDASGDLPEGKGTEHKGEDGEEERCAAQKRGVERSG